MHPSSAKNPRKALNINSLRIVGGWWLVVGGWWLVVSQLILLGEQNDFSNIAEYTNVSNKNPYFNKKLTLNFQLTHEIHTCSLGGIQPAQAKGRSSLGVLILPA
jgi:hypothetical protein